MRLLVVNSIILACIATAIAEDSVKHANPVEETVRPKRHLLEWKKSLLTKLFGLEPNCNLSDPLAPLLVREDGEVKIYKVPGYENILVKAVPRVALKPSPIVKEVIHEDPNVAIIQSYLGTGNPYETMESLDGIGNLIKSGIILRPRPVAIPEPPRLEPFRVVPARGFPAVRIPKTEAVSKVPIHYSYKQFGRNGITSYSSHGNKEVVVKEVKAPLPIPPPFVLERFIKIWKEMPALQKVMRPAITPLPLKPLPPPPKIAGVVIPTPVHYNPPVVKIEKSIINVPAFRPAPLYTNVVPAMHPVPQPLVHYDCNGKRKAMHEPRVTCFEVDRDTPIFNSQGGLNLASSYNNQNSAASQWSSSQIHTSIPSSNSYTQFYNDGSSMTHFKGNDDEVTVIKSEKSNPIEEKKTEHYFAASSGPKVSIPVQPLSKEEISSANINSHLGEKVQDDKKPGAVYFKKPITSSYMFKLINHNDRTTPFTVVPVGDKIVPENIPSVSLDQLGTNQQQNLYNQQYVYIPPEFPSSSLPAPVSFKENAPAAPKPKPAPKQKTNIPAYYSYKQYSNDGVYEYGTDAKMELKGSTSTSKPQETASTAVTNLWTSTPITVPDQHYYYQHSKLDGSKMTFRGHSRHGVSIETEDISPKREEQSRGDLPDASS